MHNYELKLRKELLRLQVNKSDFLLDSICRNKGRPDIDNPLPYEDRLSKLWTDSFNKDFEEHQEDLKRTGMLTVSFGLSYGILSQLDLSNLSATETTIVIEQNLSEVITLLDSPFNIQWGMSFSEDVTRIVEEMYAKGIITAQTAANIFNPAAYTLSVLDESAIQQLSSIGVIWSSGSTGKQIITPVATRLARLALSQNMNSVEAGRLFADGLRDLIPLRSDIYYQRLASVVVGRARNYGKILTYDRLGIKRVEILGIPDARQCDVCEAHDGTVYEVSDVVSAIHTVLNASTPDDLINSSPFISGIDSATNEYMLANGARVSVMSDSQVLAQVGIILPVHPDCRCTYIITNKS